MGEVFLTDKSTHFMNVWCRYFSKILYNFTFERSSVMNKFLHYVAAITFCCMSAKHIDVVTSALLYLSVEP